MDYKLMHPPATSGIPGAARVVTPTGWVSAEDLAAGDLVVDSAGQSCVVRRVVRLGRGETCELGLRDGSALIAGAGQQWQLEMGWRDGLMTKVMTSLELSRAIEHGVGLRLPATGAAQLPGRGSLPIPAYTVGALLANGGISAPSSALLWSVEAEVVKRVQESLPPGVRLSDRPVQQARCTGWRLVGETGRNALLDGLRQLQLSGCRASTKFIPEPYLWAGHEDRVALLQGLMDCDGSVDASGQVTYSTASPQLARDLQHLIQSLGGRCTLHHRANVTFTSPTQPTARPGMDSFRVGAIRLGDIPPFSLQRKVCRVRLPSRSRLWNVRSVRPVGRTELVSFELEGSDTFLTEDFVAVQAFAAHAGHQRLAA